MVYQMNERTTLCQADWENWDTMIKIGLAVWFWVVLFKENRRLRALTSR